MASWSYQRQKTRKTFECRGPHNAGIKFAGNYAGSLSRKTSYQASLERENIKLNARLALRQRADLLVAKFFFESSPGPELY